MFGVLDGTGKDSLIMKRSKFDHAVALVTLIGLTGIVPVEAEQPRDLESAVAEVSKAAAEEDAVSREWTSREMARSATREIARSERTRAEEALKKLIAVQEAFELGQKGGADSASLAEVRTQLEQKAATMRAVEERLIKDTRVANKASLELVDCEERTRDRMAATRSAERALLVMEGPAADKAWEAWKIKAAEGVVQRKKDGVRYVTAPPSDGEHEAQLLSALEYELWARETIRTANQIIEQSGGASAIAVRMAAAETDLNKKKALQDFAKEQTAARKAAEKLIARKNRDIAEALVHVYTPQMAMLGGLPPLTADAWDYAKARHLLVRAGFGGTPQQVKKLHAMGLHKAVDTLVDFHLQPSAEVPLDIALPRKANPLEKKLRNDFLMNRAAGDRNGWEAGQAAKLRQWWLQRIVESPRPLQEKLTLFWHGHFANQQSVVRNSYSMYRQNELFREHAAGNFRGLLYGILHDAAMIRYLDNNKNVKGHANENLAREIMELFAMGEDQGYTEADIREAGRALTGYNFDHSTGQFRLNLNQHDAGEKTIFGQKGPWTGDDLVRLILEQPATSRFVARRLFEYFAHQDPAGETIEKLATVLRKSDYELRPMLKNLFQSEAFYGEGAMGTKIKSPVQLVAGMMRDLGVKDITDYGQLNAAVEAMGQKLLEPPDVKGWRRGRSWISANRMFSRYNSSAKLMQMAVDPDRKQAVDVARRLERDGCQDPSEVVDHLVVACFVKPLNDEQRRKLCQSLGKLPPPPEWAKQRDSINAKLRDLLVLMVSTPEYQMN
jgi:hypothetical protein|tara:strand:- start:2215 stop:4566 length:2352 start_codon:yes stop_codon:yes gene_type:complete